MEDERNKLSFMQKQGTQQIHVKHKYWHSHTKTHRKDKKLQKKKSEREKEREWFLGLPLIQLKKINKKSEKYLSKIDSKKKLTLIKW